MEALSPDELGLAMDLQERIRQCMGVLRLGHEAKLDLAEIDAVVEETKRLRQLFNQLTRGSARMEEASA